MSESKMEGKWFLNFDEEGKPKNQGRILHRELGDYYLVQLHSWIAGEPTDQVIFHLETMFEEGWVFFETAEDLQFAWEHRGYKDRARET